LTDTSQLRGGPERTGMPDIDHARNRAESALNALSRDQAEHQYGDHAPIGVEAYGAYALGAWLTPGTSERARRFAR
jgi:hypothetical protein